MILDHSYRGASEKPMNPLCIGSFDMFDAPSSEFTGNINPKGKQPKIVFNFLKFLFCVLYFQSKFILARSPFIAGCACHVALLCS